MHERSRLSLRDGIANHLITISPDFTASAMDDADASASGLRSVKKWIRKAMNDTSNEDTRHEYKGANGIEELDESFIALFSDSVIVTDEC